MRFLLYVSMAIACRRITFPTSKPLSVVSASGHEQELAAKSREGPL